MQSLHDVRDRTAEFFSTVASLQKAVAPPSSQPSHSTSSSSLSSSSINPNRLFTNPTLPRSSSSTFPSHSSLLPDDSKDSTPLLPPPPPPPSAPPSHFNLAASDISRCMGGLSEKLDRLGRLVQKKSLFDDPTREIEELTHSVKVDLEGLEQALSALDVYVKREGRGGGGKEEESKHLQTHSQVVVDNLRNSLKKKTGEFMDVLQTRTKVSRAPTTSRHRRTLVRASPAHGGDSSLPAFPHRCVVPVLDCVWCAEYEGAEQSTEAVREQLHRTPAAARRSAAITHSCSSINTSTITRIPSTLQ